MVDANLEALIMAESFSPENVNLTDASDDLIREVTCFLQEGENEYNGSFGTFSQRSWGSLDVD